MLKECWSILKFSSDDCGVLFILHQRPKLMSSIGTCVKLCSNLEYILFYFYFTANAVSVITVVFFLFRKDNIVSHTFSDTGCARGQAASGPDRHDEEHASFPPAAV